MPIPLKTRLLEWFADSSTKVQYPPQREVEEAEPFRLEWRHKMPLSTRFFVATLSLMGLFLGLLLLFAMGVVLWAFLF